jgi:hypothetical protein
MRLTITLNNYDSDAAQNLKDEIFPTYSICVARDEIHKIIQMTIEVALEDINHVMSILGDYDVKLSVDEKDKAMITTLIGNLEELI